MEDMDDRMWCGFWFEGGIMCEGGFKGKERLYGGNFGNFGLLIWFEYDEMMFDYFEIFVNWILGVMKGERLERGNVGMWECGNVVMW